MSICCCPPDSTHFVEHTNSNQSAVPSDNSLIPATRSVSSFSPSSSDNSLLNATRSFPVYICENSVVYIDFSFSSMLHPTTRKPYLSTEKLNHFINLRGFLVGYSKFSLTCAIHRLKAASKSSDTIG